MASSLGEIFVSFRHLSLERLLAERSAIDRSYAALAESLATREFESYLDETAYHLANHDDAALLASVGRRFVALLSAGLPPQSILRANVSSGDILVQVAQEALGPNSGPLVLALVRLNYRSTKALVATFQIELTTKELALLENDYA